MANKGGLFGDLEEQNTTPTMADIDLVIVRHGELASRLENARIQGHIEANVLTQVLDLVDKAIGLLS